MALLVGQLNQIVKKDKDKDKKKKQQISRRFQQCRNITKMFLKLFCVGDQKIHKTESSRMPQKT